MTDQKHTKESWTEAYNFEQKQMAVVTLDEWNAVHTQLTAVTKQRDELREALEKVQSSIPAHMNGDFIIEHFDSEGNYAGTEQVNPVYIIGNIVDIVDNILTKTKEAV